VVRCQPLHIRSRKMIHRIKAMGLALLAIAMLGAVAASAA
jgi:hypothetical protein